MSQTETAQGFDFKNIKAPEAKDYVSPGIYDMMVVGAKYEAPDNKTPFVSVTFATEDNSQVTQKFFLTPKALDRLQYLHEQLFEKPLEKTFATAEAIGNYFQKALNLFSEKKVQKRILVGGQEGTDGRVYANFGYANFIVDSDAPLGEFEEGSTQWKNNVKLNKDKKMLNSSSAMISRDSGSTEDQSDEMPF